MRRPSCNVGSPISNVIGERYCITPTCVSRLSCSGLYPSELVPVGQRIQAKREELGKRRGMLSEANELLEDQRDDAGEADMLLHVERYDGLDLHPRIILTPPSVTTWQRCGAG